jgi:hypothetical protein
MGDFTHAEAMAVLQQELACWLVCRETAIPVPMKIFGSTVAIANSIAKDRALLAFPDVAHFYAAVRRQLIDYRNVELPSTKQDVCLLCECEIDQRAGDVQLRSAFRRPVDDAVRAGRPAAVRYQHWGTRRHRGGGLSAGNALTVFKVVLNIARIFR